HRVGAHLVGARPDPCHFGVTPAHPEGPPRRGQGPAPWPRLRPDEEAMPGSTHLGRLTVPRLRGSTERGLIGLVAAPTTTSAGGAMGCLRWRAGRFPQSADWAIAETSQRSRPRSTTRPGLASIPSLSAAQGTPRRY